MKWIKCLIGAFLVFGFCNLAHSQLVKRADDDIPDSGDLGIIDTEVKFESELFGIVVPSELEAAVEAVVDHDDLQNITANEHLDWTGDQGATNIHAGNYTDTDTTYTAGDALTLNGTDFDFDGGASPGGELGGSWASPTIDDSVAVTSWNLTTPTLTTSATVSDAFTLGLGSGKGLIQFDDETIDFISLMNAYVGIGTVTPNAPLEVKGAKPGVVGGFQSGMLQVTGDGGQFYNSVITGHNAYNTNTQLWYLGNTSGENNDIAFINRQSGDIYITPSSGDVIADITGALTGNADTATNVADADFGDVVVSSGAWSLDTDSVSDNEIDYANVTLADFDYQTAWRVFYSNADGDVIELAFGADGTYLKSNGAASAPTFEAPAGGGDLLADGSVPMTDNWDIGNYDITLKSLTGDGTIEGATLTEGGQAVWNASETDILDSGHYIANSIDPEHLVDDFVFDTFPLTPSAAPDADYEVANKKYVDDNAGGSMNSFIAEDGDGTEVSISDAEEWKFVEGVGIDINWTDTDPGSDGDPFDLTFAIKGTYINSLGADTLANGDEFIFYDDTGGTADKITWANLITTMDTALGHTENVVDTLTATLGAGADGNAVTQTNLGVLQGVDAGVYLDMTGNGVIDLTSDGTLELHSADWDISTTGVITNTAIDADNNTITNLALAAEVTGASTDLTDTANIMLIDAQHVGTDFTADLEEEVTAGSLADDTINDDDINWADFAYLTTDGAAINEAFGAGWNADVGPAEKDDIYDIIHAYDTDDDGDIDTLDAVALAASIVELDPSVDSEAEIEAITGALFGASKVVTAGYLWVADGVDFESVVMSGDVTIASGGATTIGGNKVQLDELDVSDVSDDIAADIAAGELADNIVDSDDFVHEDWGEVTNASGSVVIEDNITVTGWTMGASVATTPGADDNDTSLATTAWCETTQDYVKVSELGAIEFFKSFVITAPDADADAAFWRTPVDITITGVHGVQVGGTNLIGQLAECDANGGSCAVVDSSNLTILTTNVNDDGSLSNASIDAGDYVGWITLSVDGTIETCTVSFEYTRN